MLVIHGIWAYGVLQVWAEDSALPAQAPPRSGRPSRAPRPHPFAAPPDAIVDALAEAAAAAGDLARKAVDDELTLRLPSVTDGPLPSPELVRPLARATTDPATARTKAAGRPTLAAWRAPVLVFEPAAAVALLGALDSVTPGDVVLDGSTGYLAAVARFAGDLVTRGRVLPTLTPEDDGYAGRWRPVLSGADVGYARELAAAMPGACRAVLVNTGADSTADSRAGAAACGRDRRPGGRDGAYPVARCPSSRAQRSPSFSYPRVRTDRCFAHRARRCGRGGNTRRRARGRGTVGRVRGLAGQRSAARRLGPHLLPPGGAGRIRRPDPQAGRADAGTWQVEFSLQSAEDPSLMLPAADVWEGAGFGWLAGRRAPGGGTAGGPGRRGAAVPGARRGAAGGGTGCMSHLTPRARLNSSARPARCCRGRGSASCCRTGRARHGLA